MTGWVPPPWRLTGRGIVLVYRFPRRFVEQQAGLDPELRTDFVGGLGAVMCLDYHSSDVGPYRELLFVPGMVRAGGGKRWTIGRIYVSTAGSVRNGIRNWAIPKQLAGFDVPADATRFRAGTAGSVGFDIGVAPFGPVWPADTGWLPLAAELAQRDGQRWLLTRPSGRGAIRLARVEHLAVDPQFFPDVSRLAPLVALHIPQFELRFPRPKGAPQRRRGRRDSS